MTFVAHPGWARYSPHFKVERSPDGTIAKIAFAAPPRVKVAASKLRMDCVTCGHPINPIRRAKGRWLFLPYCQPNIRGARKGQAPKEGDCSTSPTVTDEYERVDRLVNRKTTSDPTQDEIR